MATKTKVYVDYEGDTHRWRKPEYTLSSLKHFIDDRFDISTDQFCLSYDENNQKITITSDDALDSALHCGHKSLKIYVTKPSFRVVISFHNKQEEWKCNPYDLTQLKQFVITKYQITEFKLKYEDDDQRIVIHNDDDLNGALEDVQEENKNELLIYVISEETKENEKEKDFLTAKVTPNPLPLIATYQFTSIDILSLLSSHPLFNGSNMKSYKDKIIQYFKDKRINIDQLIETKREQFIEDLVHYVEDKKVKNTAHTTYNILIKLEFNELFNHLLHTVDEAMDELHNTCTPLHRWSVDDICNKIKWWIYRDINFLLQKIDIQLFYV